jgi:hypothetical protein
MVAHEVPCPGPDRLDLDDLFVARVGMDKKAKTPKKPKQNKGAKTK